MSTWQTSPLHLLHHLTLVTGWKPNLSLSAVESASQNNVSFLRSKQHETVEGELEAADGSLTKADASRTEGVAGVAGVAGVV